MKTRDGFLYAALAGMLIGAWVFTYIQFSACFGKPYDWNLITYIP